MSVWTLILLGLWIGGASGDPDPEAQDVEIFHSEKLTSLRWTSEPHREWTEVPLTLGKVAPTLVLQACGRRIRRTLVSGWMARGDAHSLMMDIVFTREEEEPAGQLRPLRAYVFDSDTPTTRFQDGWQAVDLQTSSVFPAAAQQGELPGYLNRSVTVGLGPVRRRGFQLALSYSGRCVLVSSIRLYYRTCPHTVTQLAAFQRTGAGSEPLSGSCVKGALEVSPPVRACLLDGEWGPVQGGCTCGPGHQVTDHTCQACATGFYRSANESGGCRPCPANSRTQREGSESCECLQGFIRLPTDPGDLGCTKPPSAPVNLTTHHHNESALSVTWEPPHDLGGRQEVKYDIACEQKTEGGGGWAACGQDVVFLPGSSDLTRTSVHVTGLKPQCDYRLSLRARNEASARLGLPPSSTATVTLHTRRPPPQLNSAHPDTQPAPQHQLRLSAWITVAALALVLLLVAGVPIAVWATRRNYSKLWVEQEVELLPVDPQCSYRRGQGLEAAPQQAHMGGGVAQLLEGLGGSRLLASLQDVLIERDTLTLGKELGKGEFGSVYEGVLTSQDGVHVKVAVKTMRVGMDCQEDLNQFLREAEIMKNFDHDNVVRLIGVTLDREQDSPLPVPLVILPYMKHGDLRRFLIATRYGDVPMFVPHQSLLRFMMDVAAGMDYLSSKGFLHRDLAARNCMLADDLRVAVADFGLSKQIYSTNYYRQKVAVRVPIKWMAPESLSESVYTTKTDVWSFGVTMWEIVTRGRTPYPGVQNHELLDLLLSGHRLKPPEDCGQRLYEAMLSCWDHEPNHRPGFRELGETLKALLSELPALEASQEAGYINQGLEAAAAAAAASAEPQRDAEGRQGNLYLASPVGAAAAWEEDAEEEDGYLKCITDSAAV